MQCLAMPFSAVGSQADGVFDRPDRKPSAERSKHPLKMNQRMPCFSNI